MGRRRKLLRIFSAMLLVTAGWFAYLYVYGNFHQVTPAFYRSAQLYEHDMEYYLKSRGIRSVINLRGPSTKPWYLYERNVTERLGIVHYDFGIGDRTEQNLSVMRRLVRLMRQAPKPVLVHCKAGADRTSLATALYLFDTTGDAEKARHAFSFRYGHFPWLGSRTVAMDKSFDAYVEHARGDVNATP